MIVPEFSGYFWRARKRHNRSRALAKRIALAYLDALSKCGLRYRVSEILTREERK